MTWPEILQALTSAVLLALVEMIRRRTKQIHKRQNDGSDSTQNRL